MAVTLTDSRLGPGTLTLGLLDVSAQIPNVTLSPTASSVDGVPTLADTEPVPEQTTAWELKGKLIQDWSDIDGIVNYLYDNDGTTVDFVWTPNTVAGVSFTGQVQVTAVEIGGDVNVQNQSDFSFPVKGKPARGAGV